MAPDLVNERLTQFYRELYESRVTYSQNELSTFFDTIRLLTLDRVDREGLEADISLEEIQTAIGKLQAGKTLASDGLPAEFYSNFADTVAPKLTALFSDHPPLTLFQNPWKRRLLY